MVRTSERAVHRALKGSRPSIGVLQRSRLSASSGRAVRDGAIVYDEIESAADLPTGWTDEQDGGHYRLERRDDDALFGYAVGPALVEAASCFPPRSGSGGRAGTATARSEVEEEPLDETPLAFLGVRSCELHAIAIQDRVFLGGPLRRPRLRGPARGRLHRRGQLRRAGRHLLLRLDGHRARRPRRASTSR